MKIRLKRRLIFTLLLFLAYRNRYRLMNRILQNERIRGLALTATMRIPYVRNVLVQTAFPSE